jgi:phosphoribosylformylglycinamidine synthase
MSNVHVCILSGYGINCETESAHAFETVGAITDIVHVNDLIDGKNKLSDYQILMFPGGFSYGDDTGSGNAFAHKLKNNLWDDLLQFIQDGKLILGICNGFQIMTRLGLFSMDEKSYGKSIHAMQSNTNNRYECRWVHIRNHSTNCVFTKGIGISHIPIAHGEGRFYCDEETYQKLKSAGQIVFSYCDIGGNPACGEYPVNPNGSLWDVAGICDVSGRILGMMPHPERALYSINEPDYHMKKSLAKKQQQKIPEFVRSNYQLFRNAVDYFVSEQMR